MDRRLKLQEELESILGSDQVYFQPPESLKIKYPAIVYERYDINNTFANNNVYGQSYFYRVTIIDSDPDCSIVDKMSTFKTARFNRHYVSDNLNHDVFTIFY